MATREEQLKAELLILTKLGQLEGRRNRAHTHSVTKINDKYDADRAKFLAANPGLEEVLLKDGDSDHAAYLARVEARAAAVPAAASEEVADSELVTE
jgi:hypothetical protein